MRLRACMYLVFLVGLGMRDYRKATVVAVVVWLVLYEDSGALDVGFSSVP